MRNTATKYTRHRKDRGRLVLMAAAMLGTGSLADSTVFAQQPINGDLRIVSRGQPKTEGTSTRDAREAAIQRIPFHQLTPEASGKLKTVVTSASYFRSMPTETVDCDPEMYTFLVRHPEVIVNIWDVMEVTKVSLQRSGPFQLQGSDGAGTASKMDLVFGNESMHIYSALGSYQGNLWARELNGKCVVILHNRPGPLPTGKHGIVASMDVFMKLDNLGADLVVKTLGPLMGKTADYNFTECASFLSQVSQTAESNPFGIQQLAKRLTKIDPKIREQFIATTNSVAQRSGTLAATQGSNKGSQDKAAQDLLGSDKQVLILSAKPNATPDVSTRRQSQSQSQSQSQTSDQSLDERVDSPTISLLNKALAAENEPKIKKQ